MSDESGAARRDAAKRRAKTDGAREATASERWEIATRDADVPAVAEPEQAGGGGLLGALGRASNSALNLGREVGGSAQRITRQFVNEAEHLVDVALTEPAPREIVHGEIVEEFEDEFEQPPIPSGEELRKKGNRLLLQSAQSPLPDAPHPAFEYILMQLCPDEARILRLLVLEGAQPAVDVRTNRPFGVGSETVAAGLSMISEVAGCRHAERLPSYLGNLNRLGLIWFSKEQVEVQRYELLQVQPTVMDAMGKAGRYAKTIRRRIEITPFGRDFCGTCFTFD
ncbi:Abi-alpha family protein [Tsukamurella sp. 1534]|uniref:Abi-alpha family protein n=1 Tax=Tsukamurella sp. 1534 TaxID=1151061 RepID=UPI0002FBD584|nr:Abi-alpha family protein [Tsukamurella sp. 1534]